MNKYQVVVYPRICLGIYAEDMEEAEIMAEEELKDRLEDFEIKIEDMDTQEIEKVII